MGSKRTSTFFSVVIAVVLLAANLPLSLGQMCCTPCSILNLNLTFPTRIQAGRPFSLVSTMTIWCYSFLPKIRIDLVDATSYETLSTATLLLHYSSSGSYVVSMANNAIARNVVGSWAVVLQAYVLDRDSGYSVAWWLQLFQVVVLPYTPEAPQTVKATTLAYLNPSFASQLMLPITNPKIDLGVAGSLISASGTSGCFCSS